MANSYKSWLAAASFDDPSAPYIQMQISALVPIQPDFTSFVGPITRFLMSQTIK